MQNKKESLLSVAPDREERPSFGVTTFVVATHNSSRRLYSHKRVVIPLIDAEEGKAGYTVEMRYPRTWLSKDVPMRAKIESTERGFSQVLKVIKFNFIIGKGAVIKSQCPERFWGITQSISECFQVQLVTMLTSFGFSLLNWGIFCKFL